jgi:serine/threonine protein kinase
MNSFCNFHLPLSIEKITPKSRIPSSGKCHVRIAFCEKDKINAEHKSLSSSLSSSSSSSSSSYSDDDSELDSLCDSFDFVNDIHFVEKHLFALSVYYQFIKRLSESEGCVVYHAYDKNRLEYVVVKISIEDDYRKNENGVPFEVLLMNRLQTHENICPLYGWHSFGHLNTYALVTPYIPFVDFDTFIYSQQDHKAYIRQMLTGLAHMHSRGVIYRDLKPCNFLWNENNKRGVFIDYDCSSFFNLDQLPCSVLGTAEFLAPELVSLAKEYIFNNNNSEKMKENPDVAMNDPFLTPPPPAAPKKFYDCKSDVYSCGVIMGMLHFKDLYCKIPYKKPYGPVLYQKIKSLMEKKSNPSPPPLRNNQMTRLQYFKQKTKNKKRPTIKTTTNVTNPEVDQKLDLIMKMLAENPNERLSAQEALQHAWFQNP